MESTKWAEALELLGFEMTSVAGSGIADRLLPGLAMYATDPPTRREVEDALAGADLVVVENLCSLPLNPAAASIVADVLRGRRAILHHHDLPWQREQFAAFPPPPDDDEWLHVTINQISRHQLALHGIEASVVRNRFDVDVPTGRRARGRASLGAEEGETLVLQPTRAIARKNVGSAIALTEALGATFWLLGPAEDGFGPELERIVSRARCRVLLGWDQAFLGRSDATSVTDSEGRAGPDGGAREESGRRIEDAYAACDVVVLPSTWEGFGNPAIESATHRRPLAIGSYPVAAELASFGFRWFASSDAGPLLRWLERPDVTLLDHNQLVAKRYFSTRDLPDRIWKVIERAGWTKW